jgi:hypothetical protein
MMQTGRTRQASSWSTTELQSRGEGGQTCGYQTAKRRFYIFRTTKSIKESASKLSWRELPI